MCCKPLAKPPVKNFEDWEGERKAKNRPIEPHDAIQSCSYSEVRPILRLNLANSGKK
jgi:hypothetical protein